MVGLCFASHNSPKTALYVLILIMSKLTRSRYLYMSIEIGVVSLATVPPFSAID
jgi:hypothetical protein